MIFTFLIISLMTIVAALISPVPNLPDIPSEISTAGDWVITQVEGVIGVLNLIYGHTLLVAIMGVTASLFLFSTAYHTIMWVLRKIPILNIK